MSIYIDHGEPSIRCITTGHPSEVMLFVQERRDPTMILFLLILATRAHGLLSRGCKPYVVDLAIFGTGYPGTLPIIRFLWVKFPNRRSYLPLIGLNAHGKTSGVVISTRI